MGELPLQNAPHREGFCLWTKALVSFSVQEKPGQQLSSYLEKLTLGTCHRIAGFKYVSCIKIKWFSASCIKIKWFSYR